jgi:hypothetical protein
MRLLMARTPGCKASRPPQFSVKGLFVITACIAINLALVRNDVELFILCATIWCTAGITWLLGCVAYWCEDSRILAIAPRRRPGEIRFRAKQPLAPIPYLGLFASFIAYLYVAHAVLLNVYFVAPGASPPTFVLELLQDVGLWSTVTNVSLFIFVVAATIVGLANGGGRTLVHRVTIAAVLALIVLSFLVGR